MGQPTVNDPQLAQAGRVRVWLQEGIANPGVPYNYQGLCELQKTDQNMGAKKPVWAPSASVRNRWDLVDAIVESPDLIKSGFMQHANRYLADRWVSVRERGVDFNLQVVFSNCARPDDISQWDAKILLGRTRLDKFGFPVFNPLEGSKNAIVDINGDFSSQSMTILTPMVFTQTGTVTAVAEIVDAFYYDQILQGDCGVPSDGCQKVYALQIANSGSPGLSSQLLYSQDGGYTWAALDIPTLGGLSATRMAPMGLYCIVVSANQGAYHYAKFSDILAGTVNWTQITGGFTAGKSPRCITSRDPNTAWIGAQGGVVYLLNQVSQNVQVLTDGSLTSQDINDIHYYGRTIVAVGNNNSLIYSINNGNSWASATGPVVGQNLSAVWCQSAISWFVATGNGQLWYTLNAGANWTRIQLDAGITSIDDLQMFDENVGYVAVEVSGAARVYRTTDGGNTWRYSPASEIGPLPGAPVRIDVVAPCGANTLLAVGRKTVGGAGYMALARNPQ